MISWFSNCNKWSGVDVLLSKWLVSEALPRSALATQPLHVRSMYRTKFLSIAWHLSHLMMVTIAELEIRRSDSTAALKQWKHWMGLEEIYILWQLSGSAIVYLNEIKEDLSEMIWADWVGVSAVRRILCLSYLPAYHSPLFPIYWATAIPLTAYMGRPLR